MSAVDYVSIECDSPTPELQTFCPINAAIEPMFGTTDGVRKLARAKGWTQIDDWDLCPSCQRIRSAAAATFTAALTAPEATK